MGDVNMSEQLARRIRTALGEFNDDDQPVTGLVLNVVHRLTTLQAEKERLRRIVAEIWDTFYGQNMSVNNWHLNGCAEPMDSFFENNDWSIEDESAMGTQKTA